MRRYSPPKEGEIHREIIVGSRLTRLVKKLGLFEYDGAWKYYLRGSSSFLSHLSMIKYTLELISYLAAIALIQYGYFSFGATIGVVGILFANHLSSIEVQLKSRLMAQKATVEIDRWYRQRQRLRDK